MAYPHKAGLENYDAYYKTLPEVAESSDKRLISRFCSGLDSVSVFALYKLKGILKKDRGCLYKSCDALYAGSDGRYYYIEFKDQPAGNVDRDVLRTKAMDSLVIAGLTFASDQKLVDMMKRSVLIVVYDNPDDKILELLSKFAEEKGGQKDRYGEQVLWGLDSLQERSFFDEVHSWSEGSFRKIFVSNLP